MTLYRRWAATAAVFVLSGLWLYWLYAHRFVLIGDEGIFADGGRRILAGQVPYRDFFIVMGPGTFWLQALALRVFGVTLAASRAVMVLDLSIMAACVFWLVSRVNAVYAGWTAAVLLILETADPSVALPTHRWDSAAFATLAVTLYASRANRWAIFAAGCCAAFSGWITPPVALVCLAAAAWLWFEDRSRFMPFLAGCAAVTIGCATALAIHGALGPMLHQFLWTGSNYSASNHMFYGDRFGGYAALFAGGSAFDLVPRALIVLGLTLPAFLPPLAACSFAAIRTQPLYRLLFLSGLALVVSTYPRMDVPHLTYIAPLFYALIALLAASMPWQKIRMAAFGMVTLLAVLFAWQSIVQHGGESVLQADAGTIRASPQDAAFVRRLQLEVPPGSSLFVFPYLPMAHLLTLDRNPTRYSYLQPGMMNDQDEAAAIAELRANPPEKVLYFDLPESEILRIWPNTDPRRLRLRRLEAYLAANYRRRNAIAYGGSHFDILEPNPIQDSSLQRGGFPAD